MKPTGMAWILRQQIITTQSDYEKLSDNMESDSSLSYNCRL